MPEIDCDNRDGYYGATFVDCRLDYAIKVRVYYPDNLFRHPEEASWIFYRVTTVPKGYGSTYDSKNTLEILSDAENTKLKDMVIEDIIELGKNPDKLLTLVAHGRKHSITDVIVDAIKKGRHDILSFHQYKGF